MPRSWRLLVCAIILISGAYHLSLTNVVTSLSIPSIHIEIEIDNSLSSQLSRQFPYDVQSQFPSYIWQTWKDAPGTKGFAEYQSAISTWDHQNPSLDHRILSDAEAYDLLKDMYSSFPHIIEAYESLPKPVLKADFFRYLILLAKGGIYTDIDTDALKPASIWVPGEYRNGEVGLVVGIEADPDREDWKDWYSRRIQFCQWTILSKPGHPVLVSIVTRITTSVLKLKSENKLDDPNLSVVELTGPAIWTDLVFAYFNRQEQTQAQCVDKKAEVKEITFKEFTGITSPRLMQDVLVLPITSFSPGVGHMGSKGTDHPMAFVRHKFAGSWKEEVKKR